MEKKKQRLLLIAWLSVAVVSRILYFFLIQGSVNDTYAYYADTIARAGSIDNPVLSSGLAYAYTQVLSGFLGFFGASIKAAVGVQVILQILWLSFFFFGAKMLFGETAAYISGTVLLVSPYLLFGLKTVEPANFYIFHWSILLFLFGVFKEQTAKKGWYRNNSGELFLILIGFYLGVICTWNYLGWLLLPVMAYVLKKNYDVLWEGLWKQKNLQLEEKEQLMPVVSQCFILIMGMLVGIYATLMKYTGLTGKTLPLQFYWWTDQFDAFPGRCQEISQGALLWLLIAIFTGIAGVFVMKRWKEKAEEKREYEAYQRMESVKKEPETLKKEKKIKKEPETSKKEKKAKETPETLKKEKKVKIEPETLKQEINTQKEADAMKWKIKAQKTAEKVETKAPAAEKTESSWLKSGLQAAKTENVQPDHPVTQPEKPATVQQTEQINEKNPAGKPEVKEGYFTAADGREIKYIDNPLPGPKKHVKKEMDFQIRDIKETGRKVEEKKELKQTHPKDDFDYHFEDGDDFDFE